MAANPPPPLPTVQAFKIATTVRKGPFARPRKNISVVDVALEHCLTQMAGNDDKKKISALKWLIAICDGYKTAHVAKGATTTSAVRLPQVNALGMQAFKWLAWVSFGKRKAEFNAHGPKAPAIGLKPGYAIERTQRVALKANNAVNKMPVSGTFVHQQQETYAIDANQFPGAPPPVITALQKSFDQLTQADYTAIGAYLTTRGAGDADTRVYMMDKQTRLENMLIVKNGEFYTGFDQPLDPGTRMIVWAMDQYGSIFGTASNTDASAQGATNINHSTMNAGKDVICAGEIVKIGQNDVGDRPSDIPRKYIGWMKITNGSGHYKPTAANLVTALQLLADDHLDFSKWIAGVMTANGTFEYALASEIVRLGRWQPRWF
ncbi:hypothetical protein ACOSOMT5_P1603 [Acidiphilium sp. MT5]